MALKPGHRAVLIGLLCVAAGAAGASEKPPSRAGRSPWGPSDEIGTLNMMTAASRSAVLVRVNGERLYDLSVEYFVGMPSWYLLGDPRYQFADALAARNRGRRSRRRRAIRERRGRLYRRRDLDVHPHRDAYRRPQSLRCVGRGLEPFQGGRPLGRPWMAQDGRRKVFADHRSRGLRSTWPATRGGASCRIRTGSRRMTFEPRCTRNVRPSNQAMSS